jgi:cytochrome P450
MQPISTAVPAAVGPWRIRSSPRIPSRSSPQARHRHSWLARNSFGYVITEYAAIKELLGMDDKLRVAHEGMIDLMNARGSQWGAFQLDSILGIGGERHKRIRDVLAATFHAARRERASLAHAPSDFAPAR